MVTLGCGDQGEPQAGITSSGLDDSSAGFQVAVPFRRFDHDQSHPVFDRTSGILRLQFDKQLANTGIKTGNLEQRRSADQ